MFNNEKIPEKFFKDQDWALEHYQELVRKFPEKWVAIIDEKVVAYDESPNKVRQLARKKTGKEHIPVLFVEGGVHVY